MSKSKFINEVIEKQKEFGYFNKSKDELFDAMVELLENILEANDGEPELYSEDIEKAFHLLSAVKGNEGYIMDETIQRTELDMWYAV